MSEIYPMYEGFPTAVKVTRRTGLPGAGRVLRQSAKNLLTLRTEFRQLGNAVLGSDDIESRFQYIERAIRNTHGMVRSAYTVSLREKHPMSRALKVMYDKTDEMYRDIIKMQQNQSGNIIRQFVSKYSRPMRKWAAALEAIGRKMG